MKGSPPLGQRLGAPGRMYLGAALVGSNLLLLAACAEKGADLGGALESAETGEPCTRTSLWYADADGDGFGTGLDPVETCTQPEGYLSGAGDCDDADAGVFPGAAETCDGVDQDCDGETDEGEAEDGTDYAVDSDGDGYGDPTRTLRACSPGEGLSEDNTDCDDQDASTYPGAPERCGDGVANGCGEPADTCDWRGTRTLAAASALLLGADADDHAGGAVAGLDANGDGWGDLAVGAYAAGRAGAGAAYLVRTPVSGTIDLAVADGVVSGAAGEQVGTALAGAGDLDGDGLAELIVGAPGAGEGGQVALRAGPAVGGVELSEADVLLSGASGGQLGAAVAGGLDADGDGVPDLLLGDPASVGGAWLVSGAAPDLTVFLHGEIEDGGAGLAVALVGDADGDGLADLAVGAPYGGAELGGAAWLVLAPVSGPTALDDANWSLEGAVEDHVGRSVAGLDADGDGYADLLVGATGADAAGENAGVVYLLRGPPEGARTLSDADAVVLGEAEGDGVGFSVVDAGDLDGDGAAVWAVGATGEDSGGAFSGAVYLVTGAPEGTFSLADADAKLTGAAAGDSAGVGLSAAGDSDGDGRGDLLIGAWGVDAGGDWAGAALLVPGGGY